MEPRAAVSPMIGQVVNGRYTITQLLGRGGMGVVYLAHDQRRSEGSPKEVVIKMIAPILRDDAEAVARFEREARRLQALDHPNIVHFLGYGREEELSYLVMEYVDGELLLNVLEASKKLGFRDFVPIASQILKGVGYAHSRDVLLRDIKPSNVMLCEQHGRRNFVKLLDFGLAKVRQGEVPITTTHVLGTAGYIAPEVLRGAEYDLRGDVYALGVLFYRMLSGRLPLAGTEHEALIANTLHAEPPPLESIIKDPAIPPGLFTLIHRCLAKDPDARPEDANAMVEELIDVVPAHLFRLPRAARRGTNPTSPAWEFSDQYPLHESPSGPAASRPSPTAAALDRTASQTVRETTEDQAPAPANAPVAAAAPRATPPRGGAWWIGLGVTAAAFAVGAAVFVTRARPETEPHDAQATTTAPVAHAAVAATTAAPLVTTQEVVSQRLRDAERAHLQGNHQAAIDAYLDVLDLVPDHALATSGLQRVREEVAAAMARPPEPASASTEMPPPPPVDEPDDRRTSRSRKSPVRPRGTEPEPVPTTTELPPTAAPEPVAAPNPVAPGVRNNTKGDTPLLTSSRPATPGTGKLLPVD